MYFESGDYPYIHYDSHLEHGLALPMVVLHACTMTTSKQGPPTNTDLLIYVGGYVLFYLLLTNLNHYATGEWVYPICEDITREFGAMPRRLFFAILLTIILCIGKLGLAIAHFRPKSKQKAR